MPAARTITTRKSEPGGAAVDKPNALGTAGRDMRVWGSPVPVLSVAAEIDRSAHGSGAPSESFMSHDYRDPIAALVAKFGYERRREPFRLSSGFLSRDYVDGKAAITTTSRLPVVAEAILKLCANEGVEFDAVGGLTMGADPIALAVVLHTPSETSWFSVRKEAKGHGKQRRIEGAAKLGPDTRVLLVDDVVTTGRSILEAYDAIKTTGARVELAVALVDRGEATARKLKERGIRYRPVITYRDLGIEPVPDE